MRWLRRVGFESLAWSLRRLHCPVPPGALVLEVGSGGNPYPRANVLLDAYEETRERHWVPLKLGRPFVFGFAERLPFRDKAFDFVIASHVLEHSSDPARFLGELQRVASAGYIEVPDAFMERVNPYRDHRLEVTQRDGRLVIRKKPGWRRDPDLVELYEDRAKPFVVGELIPRHPFAFHVRHYWNREIEFTVVDPDVDASWPPPPGPEQAAGAPCGLRSRLREAIADALRSALSQTRRNRRIRLLDLLRCPSCGADPLSETASQLACRRCSAVYELRDSIPLLYPPDASAERA